MFLRRFLDVHNVKKTSKRHFVFLTSVISNVFETSFRHPQRPKGVKKTFCVFNSVISNVSETSLDNHNVQKNLKKNKGSFYSRNLGNHGNEIIWRTTNKARCHKDSNTMRV